MRIKVRSDETNFNLWIPTRVFFNPLTAAICTKFVPSAAKQFIPQGTDFTDLRKLFKELRHCRKYLNGEPIVSAVSSDGGSVEIYL